jgi:exonuclease SbcC
MELHTLTLRNFRQHANTTIRFDRGLTGIVGTNGSGKSTILEAIAFALYGVQAARGAKDTIKHRGAGPRASVSVTLTFTAGAHHVRIERSLSAASVFLGASDTPVATSLGGATEWIERTLGMTRAEFFTTYFTGQKELAVMGSLGPADRARFLSRVLGYDRLEAAQQLAREARRGLVSEASALQATMPAAATLEDELAQARGRSVRAATALADAADALVSAQATEQRLRPTWEQAQATRTEQQQLETKHGAITLREEAIARDVLRLEREQTDIAQAIYSLPGIEADLATLPALREEGARLDREAAADTERQRLLGVLAHVQQQAAALPAPDEAAAKVIDASALVEGQRTTVAEWQADVEKAQRRLREEESAWRDQLATAKAELQQARAAVRPLLTKREALVARGPESPCSTCGVALGERYAEVLASLDAEFAAQTAEGTRLAERAVALETEPEAVSEWRHELQRDTLSAEQARLHLDGLTKQLAAAEQAHAQSERLNTEQHRLNAALAALPTTYDHARHAVVRTELARLAPLEARRAVLADKAAGAARVAEALEQIATQRRTLASERADVEARLVALGLTGEQFDAIRRDYGDAERAARVAIDTERAARDAAERSEDALRAAQRRIDETADARARLATLDRERLVLEELDCTMAELRADLNGALRPELAELASALLETLTDGRYTHAEFGEDYQLTLVEDGMPKPVISGGEEDLCNLVLRLAISQMIAERSGSPFSLLILDEVTAALDEQRRANVLAMLRRLGDRFAQVIVITHDQGIRDAMDHVIRVELDVHAGVSRVRGGAEAVVAESPALEMAA